MAYQNVYNNQANTTQLRNFLETSVKKHLMFDVPYGVLLSDGLDSSIISGIAKKFTKNRIEESSKKDDWFSSIHLFAMGLRCS